MKTKLFILAFSLLFVLPNISKGQCYTVLSVKGVIIVEKTGMPLQEMDEICASDKLTFKSKDSKAAVLSSEQGRYILKPNKNKKDDNITAFVKSVLMQGTGSLSTRGGVNIENEFGESYFVIGVNKLRVDSETYPMNESCFFYIKYKYNGEDINKKLKFSIDTLLIDKESIYKIDEKEIDLQKVQGVSLFYYEKEKNTSTKIASFILTFADEKSLEKELKSYINLLKSSGKDNELIAREAALYVSDLYGNINSECFKAWLFEKFDLK